MRPASKEVATLAAITRMLSGSKPRRSLTRATTRNATALASRMLNGLESPPPGSPTDRAKCSCRRLSTCSIAALNVITVNAASTVPVIASSSCRPPVPDQEVEARPRSGSARKPKPVTRLSRKSTIAGDELDGVGHVGLDAGRRAVGEAAEQQESRQSDERRKETQHVRRAPDPVGQRRLDDLDPSVLLHGHTGDRVMPRQPGTSRCAGAVRTARLRRPGPRPGRPGARRAGRDLRRPRRDGRVGLGAHDRSGHGALRRGGSLVAGGPGQRRAGTRSRGEALRRLRADGVPLRPDGTRVDLGRRGGPGDGHLPAGPSPVP